MRKLAASLSALALVTLGLAGCSATPGCTPVSPAGEQTQQLVTATGPVGESPEVQVFTPLEFAEGVSWQEVEGSGTPITSPTQLFAADLQLINGSTGEPFLQSEYGDSPGFVLSGAQLEELFAGSAELLECAQSGSRVVLAIPADAVSETTREQTGLAESDSVVGIIDVRDVYLDRADGAPQIPTRNDLPAVVLAPDGRPGVTIPPIAPPASASVEVLKEGTGDEVTAESTAIVNVTEIGWTGGSVVNTTWGDVPAFVSVAEASTAYAEQLVGHTVGSQLLIVNPNEDGTDATIFVVDILGIAPTAPAQ